MTIDVPGHSLQKAYFVKSDADGKGMHPGKHSMAQKAINRQNVKSDACPAADAH